MKGGGGAVSRAQCARGHVGKRIALYDTANRDARRGVKVDSLSVCFLLWRETPISQSMPINGNQWLYVL